jgi:hypothetical protein
MITPRGRCAKAAYLYVEKVILIIGWFAGDTESRT